MLINFVFRNKNNKSIGIYFFGLWFLLVRRKNKSGFLDVCWFGIAENSKTITLFHKDF